MDTEVFAQQVERDMKKGLLREVSALAFEYRITPIARCICRCHQKKTVPEGYGAKHCKHCFLERVKALLAT